MKKRSNSHFLIQTKISKPGNKDVKDVMNNPSFYFDMEKNPLIGKGLKGPRFNPKGEIVKYSVVCPVKYEEGEKIYRKLLNTKGSISTQQGDYSENLSKQVLKHTTRGIDSSNNQIHRVYSKAQSNKYNPFVLMNHPSASPLVGDKTNYKLINHGQLDQIYSAFKTHKQSNSINVNNFLKEIPKKVQDNILLQEHYLNVKGRAATSQEKVANRLEKVLKTKKEDLLMFKSSDSNRMKNEVKQLLDYTNNYQAPTPINKWITSLRRPPHFSNKRDIIMNVGTNEKPTWINMKERETKEVELVRTPTPFSPLKTGSNNAYCRTLQHFKIDDESDNFLSKKNPESGISSPFTFHNIKNIDDLCIEGKDLLQSEIEVSRLLSPYGKVKLYNREKEKIAATDEVIEVIKENYNERVLCKIGNNKLF